MREQADSDLTSDGRPTLGEETRARARARILQGAVIVLAEKGFEVTADDVADSARVSRRTVFRHFATHGDLLVAAVSEVLDLVAAEMPGPPSPGADVQAWLIESAVALHELLRRLVGRAFWDIHVERPGTPPAFSASLRTLIARRDEYARQLATAAWQALGGRKAPPQWVIDAFVLQLSGFATNAMVAYSPRQAGEVSARILWAVLESALDEEELAAEVRPART
ncbi:MAG: helix-turn-helix domain-containing protein [Acidimicrobiales bacterium]